MRKFKKSFVQYFVPHKRNKYKPHFLRLEVAGTVALTIVVLFLGAVAEDHFFVTSGSPETAAVVASSLIALANADRAQNGLPPLSLDPQLQEAAQLKADDMAESGYFAHTSPSGKDPWYWFQQAGYNFAYAGENLAVYFSDSDAVNTAWMNSPEHRANLLSPNYTQIGIATADGLYQGVETTFVVQEFGTPAAVAIAAPPPAPVVSQNVPAPAPSQPTVAGASTAPPKVTIIAQDQDGIAVKNVNAPAPALTREPEDNSAAAPMNPLAAFFLKLITSPQSDLMFLYYLIGAVVVFALMLEIGVEIRRQHPHRIAVGLSLIALMLILVYVDHALLTGNVIIA